MAVRESQLLLTPKVTQALTPHHSKPQDLLQGTAGKGCNLQWGNPFPGWDSNPGRGNESAKSCPLDYQG